MDKRKAEQRFRTTLLKQLRQVYICLALFSVVLGIQELAKVLRYPVDLIFRLVDVFFLVATITMTGRCVAGLKAQLVKKPGWLPPVPDDYTVPDLKKRSFILATVVTATTAIWWLPQKEITDLLAKTALVAGIVWLIFWNTKLYRLVRFYIAQEEKER